MAIYADITIDKGSKFNFSLICDDLDNNVKNLTGFTARGKMRKSYFSSTAVDFTVAIAQPEKGKIDVSLSSAQTALLKAGRYVFDIEIVKVSDSSVQRVVEGEVEVMAGVTSGPESYG